jgi:hypothetical protein
MLALVALDNWVADENMAFLPKMMNSINSYQRRHILCAAINSILRTQNSMSSFFCAGQQKVDLEPFGAAK